MRLVFWAAMESVRVFALAVLLAGIAATAAQADDLGPPVGTTAPGIGTPLDQTGKARALGDLMGKKGLVLVFFRSAAWCPYCQAQLIDLTTWFAEIEQPGYRIAVMSYDSPEIKATLTAQRTIKFT